MSGALEHALGLRRACVEARNGEHHARVRVADVHAYLSANGWRVDQTAMMWTDFHHPDHESVYVRLPSVDGLADHARRICEALQTIAEVEAQS